MKIADTTTLAELGILAGQLGATALRLEMAGTRYMAAVFHPEHGHHVHTADSVSDALDGAFAKLVAAIGGALEETLS